MNYVLVAVICIMTFFAIIGFSRGLFKSAFKLMAAVITMALAFFLSPFIASFMIENTGVDDYFEKKISEKIHDVVKDKAEKRLEEAYGISEVDDKLLDVLVDEMINKELTKNEEIQLINEAPVPDFVKNALIENNNSESKKNMGVDSFYEYVSGYLAIMITKAIAFGLTYFIAGIAFTIIASLVGAAVHLPIISTINRVGGLIFGLGESVVIIWLAFTVIAFSISEPSVKVLYDQIQSNDFLRGLYNSNVINGVVSDITSMF